MPLSTPVLLLGFNRPDEMRGLIECLRPHAPEHIYIAVDGPREGRPAEADNVARTRAATELIDWPCEVNTLFRDRNLGCGPGVSSAISWFFDNVDAGIILEDDIRPAATFFPFVEELLERYGDDDRVWAVSGNNFVPPEQLSGEASYRFAVIPHIWGWATWRRTWRQYNFDLSGWQRDLGARRLFEAAGRSPAGYAFWWRSFSQVAGNPDTWDFQFTAAAMRQGALTATSNVNLTENVGFGADSTHTVNPPDFLRSPGEVQFPLVHPYTVGVDQRAETWTRRHVCGATYRGVALRGVSLARAKVVSTMGRGRSVT